VRSPFNMLWTCNSLMLRCGEGGGIMLHDRSDGYDRDALRASFGYILLMADPKRDFVGTDDCNRAADSSQLNAYTQPFRLVIAKSLSDVYTSMVRIRRPIQHELNI